MLEKLQTSNVAITDVFLEKQNRRFNISDFVKNILNGDRNALLTVDDVENGAYHSVKHGYQHFKEEKGITHDFVLLSDKFEILHNYALQIRKCLNASGTLPYSLRPMVPALIKSKIMTPREIRHFIYSF